MPPQFKLLDGNKAKIEPAFISSNKIMTPKYLVSTFNTPKTLLSYSKKRKLVEDVFGFSVEEPSSSRCCSSTTSHCLNHCNISSIHVCFCCSIYSHECECVGSESSNSYNIHQLKLTPLICITWGYSDLLVALYNDQKKIMLQIK